MALPAFPTFATSTTTPFEGLTEIRAGQQFVLRGYVYQATGDAAVRGSTVFIKAVRRHTGMPSGWELADVMEWAR